MNRCRTYRPVRHVPASLLRNADGTMCPHTYGVRVCLCAAVATEPCRPTACRLTQTSSFFPRTVRCAKLCEKWLSYLSEAISH